MESTNDRARFRAWLQEMQPAVQQFLVLLPKSLQAQLDNSGGSLLALEAWLLDRYPSVAAARPEQEAFVVGGAARYFGEVLRKRVNGQWELEDRDPSAVFYGLPIVTGGLLSKSSLCPRCCITASLDRRTGTYLKAVLDNLPSRPL